jgi:hypothetical protein
MQPMILNLIKNVEVKTKKESKFVKISSEISIGKVLDKDLRIGRFC